ncbi:hypothetical protein FRC19_002688 [Serendipita sp. 401]|nr:hypothetical protein FRC19_002688 [Serendipita sp. 401]
MGWIGKGGKECLRSSRCVASKGFGLMPLTLCLANIGSRVLPPRALALPASKAQIAIGTDVLGEGGGKKGGFDGPRKEHIRAHYDGSSSVIYIHTFMDRE